MKEMNRRKVLCIVLTMIMLSGVFAAIAAPPTVIAQGEMPISALERIHRDHEAGKITIDEYILYKTWAVFYPDKLSDTEYGIPPDEVQIRKSGTPMILEIIENWDKLSKETQDTLRCTIFLRPDDATTDVCGVGFVDPLLNTIDSTHFRVHYNTTGPHAVTNAYAQNISDYFETSYDTEVSSLGYLAPPSDLAAPNNGGDARYDVYIYDLGTGLYGYACPEQTQTPSYSYIAVNRDYSWVSPNDDPGGDAVGAAKVTAAHEFHHAIQFGYDVNEQDWWMEITSTYMEDEVYPEVNDNYNYLGRYFVSGQYQYFEHIDQYSLTEFNGWHEYGSFIWAKRLSEDFGDSVIREIWEECQVTDGLTAIDNVLSTKGSNVVREFNNFMKANFFLEDMYVDGGDYRNVITGNWHSLSQYDTTFDGVYLEYQYNAATDGLPFTINSANVNRDAWMDTWAADYVTLTLDPGIKDYRVYFDGLDDTTDYSVNLVTKKGAEIEEQTFSLDAQKDGHVDLTYDTYDDVVLIIMNAGNTDTTSPSWEVTITHRMAVTEPYFDEMQDTLDSMNYEYVTIAPSVLTDYDQIKMYDIIFVNCADGLESIASAATGSVRQFVANGGVLYASDWAFTFLENSFPGYVDFIGYDGEGDQYVDGDVVDAGLADYLGASTIQLYFDMGSWIPIDSVSGAVKVYVMGDVTYWAEEETAEKAVLNREKGNMMPVSEDGTVTEYKPIVVGFEYGDGTVIYTSFHHRAQEPMTEKLMKYLALTTVTEDLAKENKEILESEGYEVIKDNRGMIDQDEAVTYTYEAEEGETFKILLNWPGSELRLSVYAPGGELYDEVQSDTPPISVVVTNAESSYTYNVTGTQVPYDNYEYAVAVGKLLDIATEVSISPPSQEVICGDSFSVNVTVDPKVAIAGVQFNLSFNASVVIANSVAEGNLLSQGGASTFFQSGTIDNVAGTITNVYGAITTPGASVSQSGTFAIINFTSTAVGTSALDLSNVIVGNVTGQAVDIEVTDGSVTITDTVTVGIDAPDEVAEGSDFIADVSVDYVENFNSCGFDVTYNQTIITVFNVTGGEIDGHTVVVGPNDWFYIPADTVDTGRIRVITGIAGVPAPGVNGTGYIAQIHFNVLGSHCQTSAIHLEGVGMYDYQANRIDTTTVDGSVHVYSAPLEITTTSLPEAKVGDYYAATLEATGSQPPYTWGATGLPAGLTCSAAGVISGTPTASGNFTITVTVTDSASPPDTDSKPLALKVYPALEITTTSLPNVKIGYAYSTTLTATGGKAPRSWGATGLPGGLTCSADGVISGTPTESGDFSVTVTVTDSFSTPNIDSKILALFVCIVGDANTDGVVDTGDITKVKRIYFGIDPPTNCADVNGDDKIDTGDITAIRIIYFGAPE